MQLSKLEEQVYSIMRKHNLEVFRIQDICLLLSIDKQKAYNIIKALKRKKAIEKIKNGMYALYDASEIVIGNRLNWPSYVSFWSALSYYKLTDNLPRTLYYASTKYKKVKEPYKYVVILKKRFFGYTMAGNITIAEKEKAIIDCLLFPKYS